ncbi:MAG TPA: RsbRD N-terminal domain-containing protein, partial [Cellvibrio sp.]|nr:RsbRD N-terminal domain-containing protein [Cellvibrio sp.]
MSSIKSTQLAAVISQFQEQLLEGWLAGLASRLRRDKNATADFHHQAAQFLPLLAKTLEQTTSTNIEDAGWSDVRQVLTEISQARVRQGYTPIETASFMFSLKEPIFEYLRKALVDFPQQATDEIATASM